MIISDGKIVTVLGWRPSIWSITCGNTLGRDIVVFRSFNCIGSYIRSFRIASVLHKEEEVLNPEQQDTLSYKPWLITKKGKPEVI
jgi:hypothetical protein